MAPPAESSTARRAALLLTAFFGVGAGMLLWLASGLLQGGAAEMDRAERTAVAHATPRSAGAVSNPPSPERKVPSDSSEANSARASATGADVAATPPAKGGASGSELERLRARQEAMAAALASAEGRLRYLEAFLARRSGRAVVRYLEAPDPDGSMVRVEPGGDVWVDLGFRDGLRVGQGLQVYRVEADGSVRPLGFLEARDVGAERSRCRLVPASGEAETGADTAAAPRPGDRCRSPLVVRGREPTLAIAGDDGAVAALLPRLDALGVRVAIDLGPGVSALVLLGPTAPELLARAALYGIPVLDAEELRPFLGPELR
ncbi:MAG: hypothetical protein D6731_22850 [Planctomycetota bacterium]|nr:MAG: hypothetical protein D6731_22850 [Planctomycetota bacterium]